MAGTGISVTTLRRKLTAGGARPSLFYAKIEFPDVLKNAAGIASDDDVSFFIKSAALPQSTLASIPINFLGREFKVPSTDRTFPDWTITIINDEDFKIRHLFEVWLEHITPGAAIFANQASFGGQEKGTVFCNMEVTQLTQKGDVAGGENKLGTYIFKDAFPVDIAEIALSWDTKDQIEEFPVTLAYQFWEKKPDYNTTSPFKSGNGVEQASSWANIGTSSGSSGSDDWTNNGLE